MRFHYRISWYFLNIVERLLFGFTISGRERIPKSGAVIVASNHISYCDPPVVGSAIPREVYFVAKEELFKNKAFGWLIKKYNAIPVRRSVGDIVALKKVVGMLRQGKAVLMFPEGTRSLSGKLLRPRLGVGMIACLAAVPVIPAYVVGTNRLGQALVRRVRLAVRFGEPVMVSDLRGVGGDAKEQYQKLTDEVMNRIANLAQQEEEE